MLTPIDLELVIAIADIGSLTAAARARRGSRAPRWRATSRCSRRAMRGGGVGVWKLGPKEARVEVVQFPCARYRFCVTGTRGVIQNALQLFRTRVHATEIPALASPVDMALRLAWA